MANGYYDAASNVSYGASGNPLAQRSKGQGLSGNDPRFNDISSYFAGIGQGDSGRGGQSLNSMMDNYMTSHGMSPQMQRYRDMIAQKAGFGANPNGGEGVWNQGRPPVGTGGIDQAPQGMGYTNTAPSVLPGQFGQSVYQGMQGMQGMFGGVTQPPSQFSSYPQYQPYQGQQRTQGMFGAPIMRNRPMGGMPQQGQMAQPAIGGLANNNNMNTNNWSQNNPWSS